MLPVKRIGVLMGGLSPESEVSKSSGAGVVKALKGLGYEVLEYDYHPDTLGEFLALKPEVCFNALHGGAGEDGTIQGFCESLKIPYTGPGVMQSALCMDKSLLQPLLKSWGFPVPDFAVIEKDTELSAARAALDKAGVALPAISKPAVGGSTVGMTKIFEYDSLRAALSEAWKWDRRALIEKLIDGPEITVTVIGEGMSYRALPAVEITTGSGFYDYEAKYTPGGSEHHVPPVNVPAEAVARVERLVLEMSARIGLQGVTRTDVMFDTQMRPYLIDVNTSPGMTSLSLVPDAARAVGMDYPALIEEILRLALARHS